MNERDPILGRVREALQRKAPKPGAHGPDPAAGPQAKQTFEQVLPAVGPSLAERMELFRRNSAELRTDFILVPGVQELHARLRDIATAEKWQRVAFHRGVLTTAASQTLALPSLAVDAGYDVAELERCDVGITECDALVAQTGSVLVTSRSAGGRAISVLPPHHVVLARVDQLVAGLPDAFSLLTAKYGANYPSMISFITGPSRTGDIERILVLGAHGPKKLTVLVTEGS